ncbi:uncharacterized protein LOC5504003 [Nematostella vectensis]|uniref:uncharacterized protein LOC5504003 n=1 Tax=Nematostella vectensis TaxID=45351 RepID=UPI0020776B01|nr:uncharacterized protein LOC5504003 [Nematostella vectensis]
MSHPDQDRVWLTAGNRVQDREYLDPNALYNFFSSANADRLYNRRVKSATPRFNTSMGATKARNHAYGHQPGWETPNLSVGMLKNPSPTPVTSRPASSRSGYSSKSGTKSIHSSPTAMYLGFQRTRCKSAPPRHFRYVPKRPQTASSGAGSSRPVSRGAPQRAWQLRTSSASTSRSLLSPEDIHKRQKERCKSAPLPYNFSAVELVTKVPSDGNEHDKLYAMTRPLTCMPNIIQNAVTHSGLRHCCSAYNTRPKTATDTRHAQFWPVARPSVYRRGQVPQYLHFVTPAPISGQSPTNLTSGYNTQSDEEPDTLPEEDLDEMVLFEESFVVPATPTEPSLSEQYDPSELDERDVADMGDIVEQYLDMADNYNSTNNTLLHPPEQYPLPVDDNKSDSDFQEPEVQILITRKSPSPEPVEEPEAISNTPEPALETTEPEAKETNKPDVITEHDNVQEDEQKGETSDRDTKQEVPFIKEEQIEDKGPEVRNDMEPHETDVPLQEPIKPPEPEPLKEAPPPVSISPAEPKVKFLDSVKISSYKPPEPNPVAPKEPPKPILKPTKAPEPKLAPAPATPAKTEQLKKPRAKPTFERREADIKSQHKPSQLPTPWVEPEPEAEKQEVKEEQKEEEKPPTPAPLEPERLPDPEFVRAPGAYKMYQPIDLLEYGLDNARRNQTAKWSTPAVNPMPQGPSYHQMLPESSLVINAIMDEEKRKREGMKPWLQGRLALSKQTSRFELPMDVKVLESMSAMDYLTQYCIISTRRKALYKNIFQKTDKDRDGIISYRELDKALKEVHVDSINTSQVRQIAEMVEADDKTKFNLKQFSAIAAFSERILFADFVTEETRGLNNTREIIEEADFCSLKSKLDGFKVSPTVRKILDVL